MYIIFTISIIVAIDPPKTVPIPTSQSAMKNAIRIRHPDIGLFTKQVYKNKIFILTIHLVDTNERNQCVIIISDYYNVFPR